MKEDSYVAAASLRYTGVATLLRRDLVSDPSGVDIALIGVPYDGGTENRPGARHGPREIRNMSSFTRSIHHVTRVNPYEFCYVADLGDVNFTNPFNQDQSFSDITDFFLKICAAGALPLSVGGDHSISLPILRAVAAERPVGMVHIDAHTDMSDREFGHKFTHGTPFKRAIEEGLLDPNRTIQIGIRGAQNSEESWQSLLEAGIRIIFMEDFISLGIGVIIAPSFGAIYFRNAVNAGFPVICCKNLSGLASSGNLQTGDDIRIDFRSGEGWNKTKNIPFPCEAMSEVQFELYKAGGLFKYGKKISRD